VDRHPDRSDEPEGGPPAAVADAREPRRPWRLLLRRLRGSERRLVPLLEAHVALCVDALEQLLRLLRDVADPDGMIRQIEATEKRADAVVAEIGAVAGAMLLPPFPREAILGLASDLDDIVDLVEDAAESIHLYHVTTVTAEAERLAELGLASGRKLQLAVAELARLDRPRAILALCAEVDALEAQADHVLRSAMSKLFRDEADVREVIRSKAIFEVLESLTDKSKDVAHDIQSIVLRAWGRV
jgi:uncharacterized protein Yka (UPF0111/DUF47 family)